METIQKTVFDWGSLPVETTLKRLPAKRKFVIPIAGSEFMLKGEGNWVTAQIINAEIVPKPIGFTPPKVSIPKLWIDNMPKDFTFEVIVDDNETKWFISLHGLTYKNNRLEAEDLVCQNHNGTFFKVVMVKAGKRARQKYAIRFPTGFGYACPVLFDMPGEPHKLTGKVPMILEMLAGGKGPHAGEIFFKTVFTDQWLMLVQNEIKLNPSGDAVRVFRMSRRSITSADMVDRPQFGLRVNGIEPVAIDTDSICAGTDRQGWINIFIDQYAAQFETEGEDVMVVDKYVQIGDLPGYIGGYHWLVWKFSHVLPSLKWNPNPAQVEIDTTVSFGTPIAIGIVKMNDGSVGVLTRTGEIINRHGEVVNSLMESGFDPRSVSAPAIVHNVGAADTNSKRIASTTTTAGLHPVVVYQYEEDQVIGQTIETLEDVLLNRDGKAQGALFMILWHLFGDQLRTLNSK